MNSSTSSDVLPVHGNYGRIPAQYTATKSATDSQALKCLVMRRENPSTRTTSENFTSPSVEGLILPPAALDNISVKDRRYCTSVTAAAPCPTGAFVAWLPHRARRAIESGIHRISACRQIIRVQCDSKYWSMPVLVEFDSLNPWAVCPLLILHYEKGLFLSGFEYHFSSSERLIHKNSSIKDPT